MKKLFRYLLLFCSGAILPLGCGGCEKNFIYVRDAHPESREALLILPGLRNGQRAQRYAKKNYPLVADYKNFDVFVFNESSRHSVKDAKENLALFIEENHLYRYRNIHAFAYILGAWTLNSYLAENSLPNLKTILYDRSPIQEGAPFVIMKKHPHLARALYGEIIEDLTKVPYPPFKRQAGVRIGFVIENRATPLMRKYKKESLALGYPHSWSPDSFEQSYDDYFYTPLNHDEMYYRFDVIGRELLYFIEEGHFSAKARRTPYAGDPFEKARGL